jgi:hypothetical protein
MEVRIGEQIGCLGGDGLTLLPGIGHDAGESAFNVKCLALGLTSHTEFEGGCVGLRGHDEYFLHESPLAGGYLPQSHFLELIHA